MPQTKTFNAWCEELNRQIRLYSPHSEPLLNEEELRTLFTAGCNEEDAYGLDSDVRNGFTLPQSIEAWKRES
jgi:hypothetical protein